MEPQESVRFKADPYNPQNRLITEHEIQEVFQSLLLPCPKISDISVYQKAFIHKSYTQLKDYEEYQKPSDCLPLFKESYETMEFLGDSLLGSIISVYLYDRYVSTYHVDEGFLTKLKIRFVCGDQLGFLSEKLGFSKFMVISKHIDETCEGRENIHILEDIYEAFLGAIYLDTKDMNLVRDVILKSIELHIDVADLISKDNNYKDQILRYFQHNFKVHPKYETLKHESGGSEGSSKSGFECKIIKENEVIEVGYGSTKKKAEQDASKKALQKFHVIS
jgi:ribonuclease-3